MSAQIVNQMFDAVLPFPAISAGSELRLKDFLGKEVDYLIEHLSERAEYNGDSIIDRETRPLLHGYLKACKKNDESFRQLVTQLLTYVWHAGEEVS